MSARNAGSYSCGQSDISSTIPSTFQFCSDTPHCIAVNTPTRLRAITEEDQIESFLTDGAQNVAEDIMDTQEPRDIPATPQSADNLVDNGLKCECGVPVIRYRYILPSVVN